MEIAIRTSINQLGDDVLFVQKWPWAGGSDYPWWKYYKRPEPTLQDLKEIERRSLAAEASAFMFEVQTGPIGAHEGLVHIPSAWKHKAARERRLS